jgi:hypothetical protein
MPNRPRRLVADSDSAGEADLGWSSSRVVERLGNWEEKLFREAKEHPGRTVAMALGAGYVIGGGLFSRLTGRIARAGLHVGIRAVLLPIVIEGLFALGLAERHPGQGAPRSPRPVSQAGSPSLPPSP